MNPLNIIHLHVFLDGLIGNNLKSVTFKYLNLDNEEDIKADVQFSNIGLTARNAKAHILGEALMDETVTVKRQTNVYIGNWLIPTTLKQEI